MSYEGLNSQGLLRLIGSIMTGRPELDPTIEGWSAALATEEPAQHEPAIDRNIGSGNISPPPQQSEFGAILAELCSKTGAINPYENARWLR